MGNYIDVGSGTWEVNASLKGGVGVANNGRSAKNGEFVEEYREPGTDFGTKGFAEVNSAIVVEKGQNVTTALKHGRVAGHRLPQGRNRGPYLCLPCHIAANLFSSKSMNCKSRVGCQSHTTLDMR